MQIKIEETMNFLHCFLNTNKFFDYTTNIYLIFRGCISCKAFGGC